MMQSGWKQWDKMKYIGKEIPRVDGPLKCTGAAMYTQDYKPEGMLYGFILRSPHAHAKVTGLDLSAAEAMPGVKAVIGLDKKTVRYYGDEVAALAAASLGAGRDALKKIKATYEILPYAVTEEEAMAENAPLIHPDGNIEWDNAGSKAAVEKIIKSSAFSAEGEFRTQVQVHACLESHSVLCQWQGDMLKVWISTQAVHGSRDDFAKLFEVPQDKVEVNSEYMGGGFGSKFVIGVEGMVAAKLAKLTGAPVKVTLDRKEESLAVGNRPSTIQRLTLACDRNGKITAMAQDSYGSGGISGSAGFPMPYIYKIPDGAYYKKHGHVRMNTGAARPQRAPGHPQSNFGMELIMEKLAMKAGIDPLEFRMINDPSERRQSQYKLGAEMIGWKEKHNKVPGSGNGPFKRGVGVSSGTWGGGGGRDSICQIDIFPDGRVVASIGTQDIGSGIRTVVQQIVAEEMGLPLDMVTPNVGKSTYPYSSASGGSRTIGSVSPPVKNASDKALSKLLEKVAANLGCSADELVCDKAVISLKNDSSKTVTWKEACALLDGQVLTVQEGWSEGLSDSGVAGCQFAEVEVDIETGRVRPIKIVAIQDFGMPMNTLTARSQINGAVQMGLSWALTEDRIMDPNTGLMVNPNFENYKLLGTMEMPEVEVVIDEMPERGPIGVGEPPRVPTAGAIATAVYNATGAWVTSIPMTPDVVLAALARKGDARK